MLSARVTDQPPLAADPERAIHERTMRKVFWRLVPFLFVCYVVAYIDRVNIGFAALTMTKEIGLTLSQFGFSAGIFFLAYFIAEIPSNLALHRFGAPKWIARIMISWGLVSGATAFVQGPVSFTILRFLLGLAEAGFTPGVFLYFSYWFPAQYRGRAVSAFILGIPLSGVVGSPISSLLIMLDGTLGVSGWRWLLLIEAVPAVLLGVACLFVLAERPANARWLTDGERTWLSGVLASELKTVERHSPSNLLSVFKDRRVLMFAAVNFCSVICSTGVAIWLPQIVRGLGFTVVQTGFVVAIPSLFGATVMIYCGRRSDKATNRAVFPISALFLSSLGLLLAAVLGHSVVLELAALSLAMGGVVTYQGTVWPLPMSMLSGRAAAGGIALIVSLGGLGGFVGPYLIGWIREVTGRFDLALLFVAGSVFLSAVLLIFATATLRLQRLRNAES